MPLTDYAVDDSWDDDSYWDHVYEKIDGWHFNSNRKGPYVIVTMTTWCGSNDFSSSFHYVTEEELIDYFNWQYLYWNGVRVYQDGTIKQVREYADGGAEVVYSGKVGGDSTPDYVATKELVDAFNALKEAERLAEEAEKAAKKAARAAKKTAKDKAEYERLKEIYGD